MSVKYKDKKFKAKFEEGVLCLDLSGERIKDISEIEGLENLIDLQVLDLGYNQISEIKGLDKLINLRKLRLINNQISEIKGLENLINLKELDLSKNKIVEIKGLETLTNLEQLNFWKNKITVIKGLDNLLNLQKLILIKNKIQEIESVESMRNLKVLALKENPIYDALERLSGASTIQKVIEYCELSVEERKEIKKKVREVAQATKKQISLIKPFIILFGILSLCFNWTTIGLTISSYYQSITVFYEFNAFGFVTGTSFPDLDISLGYYDGMMLLGGVLYFLGVLIGLFTRKTKSFPYTSIISIVILTVGIFTYISGALMFLEDWYGYLDPYFLLLFNVRKFTRVQSGMILAFITLGLIIGEFLVLLKKVEVLMFLKIEEKEEVELKLSPFKKKVWLLSLLGTGLYAVIVYIILSLEQVSFQSKTVIVVSYAFIQPLAFSILCIIGYIWITKKYPQNKELLGGNLKFLGLFFLLGVCVISWAAYWNTSIDTFWYAGAIWNYILTSNEDVALLIYELGSHAITPALVEEFLKALPFILAFFVVLQKNINKEQKNKGMLGNELNGFFIGVIIGLVFECIEGATYAMLTYFSGGSPLDLFLQVTIRIWGPVHILGGGLSGYAAGRAERLRFERGEEHMGTKVQIINFLKRFLPYWFIPVSVHFLWNGTYILIPYLDVIINGRVTGLSSLLSIIIHEVLSVSCFVLLLIFFEKASKVAEKTYHCPITGIIVASEGITCNVEDISSSQIVEFPKNGFNIHCPNCDQLTRRDFQYCDNCGANLEQFKYLPELYKRKTVIALKISMLTSIIFIVYILVLITLNLEAYEESALPIILFQTITEIISIGLLVISGLNLLRLRREYNGKTSVWAWLFLLLNLIGIVGTFIFHGTELLIERMIFEYFDEYFSPLYSILAAIFLLGGIILLFFLAYLILKEKQALQYQR